MLDSRINSEQIFNLDKPTDIEVAMTICRLLDGDPLGPQGASEEENRKDFFIKLAKDNAKTMTNPFAKKMLLDKINENGGARTPLLK